MRWWNLLNNAIFDGKLQPPRKIECKAYQNVWGECVVWEERGQEDSFIIKINSEFLDRKSFLTVLAHEMIHQWQYVTHKRMTHGKTFFQWKPMLKQTLGITLTR